MLCTKSKSQIVSCLTLLLLSFVLTFERTEGQSQGDRHRLRGEKYRYELQEEIDLGEGVRNIIFADKSKDMPKVPKYLIRSKTDRISGNRSKTTYRMTGISNDIEIGNISEDNKNINLSPLGNYYWTYQIGERVGDWSRKYIESFYEVPATLLWRKEIVAGEVSGLGYYISDYDGTIVEFDNGRGILRFYSKGGVLIKEHALFGSRDRYYGNNGGIGKFSRNGDYFVFTCSGIENSKFTNGSAMFLFNKQRDLAWVFDPDERSLGGESLSISDDGSYIVSFFWNMHPNSERNIYLHRYDRTLVKKFEGMSAAKVVFSKTNHYAALYHGNKMWLIDLTTADLAMREYYAPNGRKIYDIDISEKLGVVALIESRYQRADTAGKYGNHTDGKIRLIDFNKVPVAEIALPDRENVPGYSSKSPEVSISLDGKKIGANWGSKYYVFNLKNR